MNSTWKYNLIYISFYHTYSRASEGSANIQVSSYWCFWCDKKWWTRMGEQVKI